MLPEMRAAADKLIFDCANTEYVATTIGPRALDRPIERLGWSVRQLIGHLALSLETCADKLPKLSTAAPSELESFDRDEANAEMAAKTAKTPLPDLLETMARGRDRCIAAFADLDEQALARKVAGETTLGDVIRSWLPHFEEHALDFLDAEPKLRRDILVLNWVLYADYGDRPDLIERQRELMAEVRQWAGEGGDLEESE
ncbi:MAG: DinB family protein [Dehalococcoidia bacterium]|nr:DinB family protein [Dehalococcoidia bacterium]